MLACRQRIVLARVAPSPKFSAAPDYAPVTRTVLNFLTQKDLFLNPPPCAQLHRLVTGLTNVSVFLSVTDTGVSPVQTKGYANPQGIAFQPIQDTVGFATCP